MDENWNKRLKKCREQKGYSLKELSRVDKLDVSQQSLVKYENGSVFPRIDLLEKMCRLYGCTIDYVLYGNDEIAKYENTSDVLTMFSLLMLSKKIEFDDVNNKLKICDKKLNTRIKYINSFINNIEITKMDHLFKLIEGINKMVKEDWELK